MHISIICFIGLIACIGFITSISFRDNLPTKKYAACAVVFLVAFCIFTISNNRANSSNTYMSGNETTASISDPNNIPEGMYRVGIDIPAGEYKLVNNPDVSAYFAITDGPNSELSSIIANDNFEGQSFVSVSDGQYLKLTRCYAVKIEPSPSPTITPNPDENITEVFAADDVYALYEKNINDFNSKYTSQTITATGIMAAPVNVTDEVPEGIMMAGKNFLIFHFKVSTDIECEKLAQIQRNQNITVRGTYEGVNAASGMLVFNDCTLLSVGEAPTPTPSPTPEPVKKQELALNVLIKYADMYNGQHILTEGIIIGFGRNRKQEAYINITADGKKMIYCYFENDSPVMKLVKGQKIKITGKCKVVYPDLSVIELLNCSIENQKDDTEIPVADLSDSTIPVSDIIEGMEKNPLLLEHICINQKFSVKGMVRRNSASEFTGDVCVVYLVKQEGQMGQIRFSFEQKDKDALLALTEGQEITIKGKCTGLTEGGYYLNFEDCEIP